jgi:mono/diheme cytochrome c family protein
MRRLLLALLLAGPAYAQTTSGLAPVSSFDRIADKDKRAVALFQEAGKVIVHPRCVNCHPADDTPRQGDVMRVHEPPVARAADGTGATGMRCATCHGAANFDRVPGKPNWHLAPKEMAWMGKSLGQICEQIKDRKRNGGKSLEQIVEHMAHDELVGWGWHPGPGRTPVAGTQEQFGALIKAWADNGAHCPKP